MNTSTDSVDPTPWVTVQRKGSVAWLTLNRPAQYNALSEQMLARACRPRSMRSLRIPRCASWCWAAPARHSAPVTT